MQLARHFQQGRCSMRPAGRMAASWARTSGLAALTEVTLRPKLCRAWGREGEGAGRLWGWRAGLSAAGGSGAVYQLGGWEEGGKNHVLVMAV